MMSLLYQRYLTKSILGPLIIIALVISSIIWVIEALRFLPLIDKGIHIKDFLSLIILIFPSILFIILPFITLFAILYTYYHLSEERQLIILKNFTISDINLSKPALWLSMFITVFAYYLSFSLMPKSYYNLRNKIAELKDNYISKIVNEREFTQISPGVILYISSKTSDEVMHGIILFDNRNHKASNGEVNTILFAKDGQFLNVDNRIIFELRDGYRQSYDAKNNITELYFDRLMFEFKKHNTTSTNDKSRKYKEYTIIKLLGLYNKEPNDKILVEIHQRLIWPLFNILLTFFALSVWFKAPYNRQSNLNVIYLILACMLLINYLHFTFLNLAINNIRYIYLCYVNILFWSIIAITLFNIDDDAVSRLKNIFRIFRK